MGQKQKPARGAGASYEGVTGRKLSRDWPISPSRMQALWASQPSAPQILGAPELPNTIGSFQWHFVALTWRPPGAGGSTQERGGCPGRLEEPAEGRGSRLWR